ncbi:MAG: nuclear transport factor 2 family protein [Kofleriaceae bacterium]|nr:nuclear transport factor 2 family protein [Kofleriaceae bacterium]
MRLCSLSLLPLPLLLSASCSSSSTTVAATTPPPTVAAASAPAVVPGVVPATTLAVPAVAVPIGSSQAALKLNEAAVRRVVEQWLAAQNTGTFASYEALYAERFNGVKRVGAVVRTYDRAGWLTDRRRMFTAPMQVTATDVVITVDTGSAEVRLTQTFAQKSFKDSGSKKLLIIDSSQGLKIAREEMLQSQTAVAVAEVMPILRVAGADYVVLSTQVAPAQGSFEALGRGTGYDYSGRRKVSLSSQDPTGRRGQTISVYPGGRQCKLVDVYTLGFGTPHFSTSRVWQTGDTDGDGVADEKPMPFAEQNENAIVSEMLAGQLDACPGDVALTAPGVEWRAVDDKGVARLAAQAFIKNAGVQQAQTEFAAQGATSMWYGAKDGADTKTAVFESNGRRIVVVGASAHGGGCGDFSASAFLVFEVVDKKLVARGETVGMPSVAVALDGQSLPVLVVESKLTVPTNKAYLDTREIDFGYQDCPC